MRGAGAFEIRCGELARSRESDWLSLVKILIQDPCMFPPGPFQPGGVLVAVFAAGAVHTRGKLVPVCMNCKSCVRVSFTLQTISEK